MYSITHISNYGFCEIPMKKFAQLLRALFEMHKNSKDFPFFHEFPKNSAEGASVYLAFLASEKYPTLPIEVVYAADQAGVHHCWVEVNNQIYDITADQFSAIAAPIYGEIDSPLLQRFSIIARKSASLAVLDLEKVAENRDKDLCKQIKSSISIDLK